ncbi:hypothetical protein QBC47DRAFT_304223 [Echria macrotheca]|uniref:Rhodopsin domain-containing protein n=1 Tax=Echria macrotheca TaxID=438768 RepID=A0AAJ0B7U3_9PEZI|nr:hypothetical protein QBC47DRAFT_304223 [Echria macrotheca]
MDGLPPPSKTPPFPIQTADQRAVLGVAIAFAILPVFAVVLRLIARRISSRTLDASDYCIVVACVFAVALEAVSITGVVNCGIGYGHLTDVIVEYGMEPVTNLFKFLWALSLGFSKISILLLYSSVFAVPTVIWTARGAIIFITAWAIATIVAGCLICQPFEMNWNPTIPGGHCGDQVLSFTVTGVLNLVTDVMVLVLPLPYLARLQMRLYKKLVLLGVFSIGLLTCVISAIRIHTLKSMDFNDITYSIPRANIFSGLEPSVAVTLACIPLLRPLLGRSKYSTDGTPRYATGSATPSKALELETGDGRPFQALPDDSSQYRLRPLGPKHLAEVHSAGKSTLGGSRESSDEEEERGITVQSQWVVSEGRASELRS